METLQRLLTSRKFLTALASLIIITGVLTKGWDEQNAQAVADKLVNAILVLAGLFIGTTALEDAAAKFGNGGKKK